MTEKYAAWIDSTRFPVQPVAGHRSMEAEEQPCPPVWEQLGDIDDFIFSMEEDEWACSGR